MILKLNARSIDQIRIILDVNGEDEAEYKIKMDALDDK